MIARWPLSGARVATHDLLVIENIFGRPRFRFPPREDVHAAVRAFASDALEDGLTPLRFAYALCEGQDVSRYVATLARRK